jgi:hypothetical protein
MVDVQGLQIEVELLDEDRQSAIRSRARQAASIGPLVKNSPRRTPRRTHGTNNHNFQAAKTIIAARKDWEKRSKASRSQALP